MAQRPVFPAAILALAMLASTACLTGEAASPAGESAQGTQADGTHWLRVETLRATDGSKRAAMTVDADIPKTEVYLDGEFRGRTPLVLDPVYPGILRLTLKKDGFWARQYSIEIKPGETKKVYVELERARGILAITNAPDAAEIEIDGKAEGSGRVELTEGEHAVVVRAFGYVERRTRVAVSGNGETTLDGALERAPFAISKAKLVRKSIDPDKTGKRGASGVSFEVSAPGRAVLRVVDAAGKTVRAIGADLASRRQTILWDGRDDAGNPVPDGEYTLELRATGDDGQEGTRSTMPDGEPLFGAATTIAR
jgi:hypothetical protein